MASPKSRSPKGISISRTTLFVLIVFAFGISVRLIHLGKWAYHHDESIHAWYAYRLATYGAHDGGNLIYGYDPVYHGPFLYHIGACFFFLFGDNDFTGRLPFATFGILMLVLVYQLHHIIGKPRAIAALVFVAISPGLTYFSRFARNDVYFATETLAVILFGMLYLVRERRALWFYLLALSFALLYATKENSYVAGAILCGFLVIYIIVKSFWDAVFGEDWTRTIRAALTKYFELTALIGLYGIYSTSVFTYIIIPIIYRKKEYLEAAGAGDINLEISRRVFAGFVNDHRFFPWLILILGVLGAITWLIAIHLLRAVMERGEEETAAGKAPKAEEPAAEGGRADLILERILAGDARLVAGIAIIVCVYVFLFTTAFSNKAGLVAGVTDYVRYWAAQVHKPRIAQAELGGLYYVYFFFIYDLAAFLLALAAFVYYYTRLGLRILSPFLGRNVDTPAPDEQRVPFVVPIFLTVWAAGALLIYPRLHERVPWLYTHQVLPVAVLAGYFVGDVFIRLRKSERVLGFLDPRWVWGIFITAVCFVGVFSARADIQLNLERGDNPREIMVYVQSSKVVRDIVKEVDEIAYEAGTFEKTKIGVSGGAQWPFSWYFRHYNSIPGGRSKQYPVNITDVKDLSQLEFVFGDEFEYMKYSFRDHWSPSYSPEVYGRAPGSMMVLPNGKKQRILFGDSRWWMNQVHYFLFRQPWSPVGGAELLLFRKRQLRDIPKAMNCPAGSDQSPRPGRFVTSWGGFGSGPGQFNGARGVAASPDGFVYVCDTMNYRVEKFTPAGEFVLEFGGPSASPEDGMFFRQVTDTGVLPGPSGLACDSKGFVYVTDTWANRIQKFDSSGKFVTAWGAGGGGSFYAPRDIAVDAQDRVYVADTGKKRIQVFDSNGNYLNVTIGREGSGPGEFIEPVGIGISPNQELYVADVGNKRIQVLTTAGRFVRQWNVCGWESPVVSAIEAYLSIAPDGTVYVADSTRSCVYQFDPSGQSVIPWGVPGTGPGQLRRPTGVAVDQEGFVYVSDTDNSRINKYQKY